MTPSEFKAWFDGFTEAFEGRIPTRAQWGRIKDRVAEIVGNPVTVRIYADRYWQTYVSTYPMTTWTSLSTTSGTSNAMALNNASTQYSLADHGQNFNSMQAMAELGRAEAKSLAA